MEPLLPPDGADFVLKARHTISIPRHGVAHIHADLAEAAREMMERNMSAEITSCGDVSLAC